MEKKYRQDKGVAGLTILLSLIVILFIIGLLIMIFSVMSGEIQDSDSIYERSGTTTATGEAVTQANFITGGDTLTAGAYRSAVCTIVAVYNGTTAGIALNTGNYTEISECKIQNLSSGFSDSNWAVNYTYTYLADQYGTASVINDTSSAIATTTDWFDIFIVIGAMVVLILLTVIIITAIRSSGMIAETKAPAKVGTA